MLLQWNSFFPKIVKKVGILRLFQGIARQSPEHGKHKYPVDTVSRAVFGMCKHARYGTVCGQPYLMRTEYIYAVVLNLKERVSYIDSARWPKLSKELGKWYSLYKLYPDVVWCIHKCVTWKDCIHKDHLQAKCD